MPTDYKNPPSFIPMSERPVKVFRGRHFTPGKREELRHRFPRHRCEFIQTHSV